MCEIPDFYNETRRTCRGRSKKQLKCCECGGEIISGDEYVSISGKWNGTVETLNTHAICADIRDGMHAHLRADANLNWDELPGIGQLIEATSDDAYEGQYVPPHWPQGVAISKAALRKHVNALRLRTEAKP